MLLTRICYLYYCILYVKINICRALCFFCDENVINYVFFYHLLREVFTRNHSICERLVRNMEKIFFLVLTAFLGSTVASSASQCPKNAVRSKWLVAC